MLTYPDFEQKQIVFVLLSDGDRLSFKNDNIIVTDSNGTIKHQSTCYRLFALFIVGNITITSGLLQKVDKFGFFIIFMTTSLRVYGVWESKAKGNVLLHKKQYDYKGFDIAKKIVANKINNQLETIKSIRPNQQYFKNAVENIETYCQRLADKNLILHDILGLEGIVSKIYFDAVFSDLNWKARRPRVKQDTTNCLLDIGYTMLFSIMEALLCIYGFDLYQGVYHRQFYQRKSLVCDLVEPFRPIIDIKIRKAHNLGQIRQDDFDIIQGQFHLYGKNSKPYISWILETLLSYKKEMFLYVRDYYRAFMKDKPIENYPFFKI